MVPTLNAEASQWAFCPFGVVLNVIDHVFKLFRRFVSSGKRGQIEPSATLPFTEPNVTAANNTLVVS
eukprot:COSAG04_NODE_24048_length_328_cov_0.668122_2_plen_66_part_01